MNINNLNSLCIYIQENYPMFLTNDLTLYAIVGKIVSYTNSLIDRENQLANILAQLQKQTGDKLSELEKEINDFETNINQEYNNFTSTLTNDFNTFKENINTMYANFTEEQETTIDNFISGINSDLATFKNTIQTQVSSIQTLVNNTITSKNQEVDTALANLDVEGQIETYFNNLINDDYFTNLFNSRYGNYYTLLIYGPSTSIAPIGVNTYRYDTSTNKLYFSENGTSWNKIELDTAGIYGYDGKLYIPVNDNGTYKLQQMGG